MQEQLQSQPTTAVASPKEPWALLQIISLVTEFTNKYIMGFVIILGIGGNILSIVIFWRCRRKDHVTATYLAPLAGADLATLVYGTYS